MLESLDPPSVLRGTVGVVLGVAGTGFTPGDTVEVAGEGQETQWLSQESLVTAGPVPALLVAEAGEVPVVVVSAGGARSPAVSWVVRPSAAARHWELPDGNTSNGLAVAYHVLNPNPTTVTLTYRIGSPVLGAERTLTLAPWAAAVYGPNPPATDNVWAVVDSDAPVVMSGEIRTTAHVALGMLGTTDPATSWLMASAFAGSNRFTAVQVVNSGGNAVSAHVAFHRATGQGNTVNLSVPAVTRQTTNAPTAQAARLWAAVSADSPVAAGMSTGVGGFLDLRAVRPVPQGSTSWVIPYLTSVTPLGTGIAVANPSASVPAHVTIAYHPDGQVPVVQEHTVASLGLLYQDVSADAGMGAGLLGWAEVTADVPVVAAYHLFPVGGTTDQGAATAQTHPAQDLFLVGASTKWGRKAAVHVANPGLAAASVVLDAYFSDDTPRVTATRLVPAGGRATFPIPADDGTPFPADVGVGCHLRSNVPVAAGLVVTDDGGLLMVVEAAVP